MRLARYLSALSTSAARFVEGRHIPLSVLAGAIASTALGIGLAEALPQTPNDILPVEQVKPGMKGYGLTVFSGTKPEKFDVEVISTLHNFRPNQDLILIKTVHPRLAIARTVAGMSGSPIYLNGKMIGAYAYGWTFGAEAIAGVTPIQSMIDELNRPVPKVLMPGGGVPLPVAQASKTPAQRSLRAFTGAPDAYDLQSHGKQLAARAATTLAPPEGTSLARASTPILLGGMTPTSLKIANDLLAPMGLDPLQAGGGASTPDPSAPQGYVDGGAIGVQLVRGDISAMGLGTVTRVSSNKLVAFGHPMLGGGVEALPTAVARVHWILASQNRSFKIGEAIRPLGALVNDRQAAIVVDSQVKAPTFPIHIDFHGVDGAPKPKWDVEVAHDQFLAPAFVAMALGGAAETTTAERRDMTWRAQSKLKLGKYGTIDFVDFAAGAGSPIGSEDFSRGKLVRAVGALLNNPWEPITIERIDTDMRVAYEREVANLIGAKVLEPVIDAGSSVHIRLDLQAYRGGPIESRVIEVKVPAEMAGREVEITLAPGYEVERPLPTPNSVSELINVLANQTFDAESVVATFRLREAGAAFQGKVASRLPPGAADTLRSSTHSHAPETFSAISHTAVPLKRFLVGRDTVRVAVRAVVR